MLRTRFAPSPTGYMHLGNIRTGLFCWMLSQNLKGECVLRIDDTDMERCDKKYEYAIVEDFKWMGITFAKHFNQSKKIEIYQKFFKELIKKKFLYECFETTEELEIKKKIQLSKNMPPIYDRSALSLSEEEKNNYRQSGIKSHWRFLIDRSKPIEWNDKIKGKMVFDPKNINDPIVIRENGIPTYMLPSVIDDIDMNINYIIRGDDHITNTAIQIQMFEAIGATIPDFAHLPLLHSVVGKISKRNIDNTSIDNNGINLKFISDLREHGIHPMAIINYLINLGSSIQSAHECDIQKIIRDFNIENYNTGAIKIDVSDLIRINGELIKKMGFSLVKDYIDHTENTNEQELSDFWSIVRENLSNLKDFNEWRNIFYGSIDSIIDDVNEKDLIREACFELSTYTDDKTMLWDEWLQRVSKKSHKKGSKLLIPIRMALTGRRDGPELRKILEIMGINRVRERLNEQSNL